MGRRRKHAPLVVYLNGHMVGRLNRQSSGAVDFQYDAAWLDWEHTQPISLSLPLREDRYIGAPVLAVFDNLLPDSDAIRRRMAERVGAEGIDAFSLLSSVGRDCVGALQFLPEGNPPGPAGTIDAEPISEDEIERLLNNLAAAPLGLGDDQDFRISLAGAQEKTALLFWDGRWHRPHGTTATTHILKPQIGRLPNGPDLSNSVENEFFCLKLTAALGLPSANVEIADFGTTRTLVVERFDRVHARDGRLLRRPQEDCCQALGVAPTRKYQSEGGPGIVDILALLNGADDPERDRALFLKAQIVFWLLAATDGHAKNFSIRLSPGGRFSLAPLYDVISVQPSLASHHLQRKACKLAMSVGRSHHYRVDEITLRHFIETGAKAGMGQAAVERIFTELLSETNTAIDGVISALPVEFPQDIAIQITEGMHRRLPRLKS